MSNFPKPPKGAIAVRCIRGTGPFLEGQSYLAFKGHRSDGAWSFDIRPDGSEETRTVQDIHFIPANPANWVHFSDIQRRRYAPAQYQPCPEAPRKKPEFRKPRAIPGIVTAHQLMRQQAGYEADLRDELAACRSASRRSAA